MAKPFKELRKLMCAEDIDQRYLAKRIGRSVGYVSNRMRGYAPWDMRSVYQICDLFEIPLSEIAAYFPKEDIRVQEERINA